MPPPPSTSQVSLPSQTGATLFMITSRSVLLGKQRKQHAEAEVESVHHHIDKDREGDDEGPEGRDVEDSVHPADPSAITPAAGVMPAARAGISPRGPCSPWCGGDAISRRM